MRVVTVRASREEAETLRERVTSTFHFRSLFDEHIVFAVRDCSLLGAARSGQKGTRRDATDGPSVGIFGTTRGKIVTKG